MEAHLRPTSDRVRESLFSMLSHLGVIHGARVLDLFAGTGALGLEALSRGAAAVVFVENGRVAQGLITDNIRKLRADGQGKLLRADATKLGPCLTGPADLVFLDPPYGKGMGQQALQSARAGGWLAQGALVVWEESAPMEAPQGFVRTDRRKFGTTHVTLLKVD
jgi:16S rRNA (guanine966-N2)-methyltransferase